MDAFLPGVPGPEPIYNDPHVWHFRFSGVYPENLVEGRERTYLEYFWNVFIADKNHSIAESKEGKSGALPVLERAHFYLLFANRMFSPKKASFLS